jgi:hypothetical protein
MNMMNTLQENCKKKTNLEIGVEITKWNIKQNVKTSIMRVFCEYTPAGKDVSGAWQSNATHIITAPPLIFRILARLYRMAALLCKLRGF